MLLLSDLFDCIIIRSSRSKLVNDAFYSFSIFI